MVLELMRKGHYKGVQPNMETYSIVLSVMATFKATAEARKFYDFLARDSIQSPKLAAQVMLAYANAEDGQGALSFLEELRRQGPAAAPNGLCLSRAMLACGRSGLVEEAQALLEEMKSRGFLTERHHNQNRFLDDGGGGGGLAGGDEDEEQQKRNWEEAAKLSEAITETFATHPEITPGPLALNTALSVFCTVGDWANGVALLRQMTASFGVIPNEVNRADLLRSSAAAGQWPVAVYLLEDFVQRKWPKVGASAFAGLCDGLEDDHALKEIGPALYRQLHRQGLISHLHTQSGTVDFHRFGRRQSVCAILALLEDMAAGAKPIGNLSDLVMVVGRGKSNLAGVSRLGPYLIKALASPTLFDPPLVGRSLPNNNGRILLPRDQIIKYCKALRARRGKYL